MNCLLIVQKAVFIPGKGFRTEYSQVEVYDADSTAAKAMLVENDSEKAILAEIQITS